MKILFTYYIPSGGIETLNRLRCQALRQRGIEAEQLYLWDGAGKQNIRDIPTYFMNDQQQLAGLVHARQYDAIVVTCDHFMLERLRGGGYPGTLIYEAQGLESVEAANSTLEFASMFVRSHAQGVIAPPTSSDAALSEIFRRLPPLPYSEHGRYEPLLLCARTGLESVGGPDTHVSGDWKRTKTGAIFWRSGRRLPRMFRICSCG